MTSLSQRRQYTIYQQTKFRWDNSIHGWNITTSGLVKQTSGLLEFYFQIRFRFITVIGISIWFKSDNSRMSYDVISIFEMAAAAAQDYFRLRICWRHCLQAIKIYLYAYQILNVSIHWIAPSEWNYSTVDEFDLVTVPFVRLQCSQYLL